MGPAQQLTRLRLHRLQVGQALSARPDLLPKPYLEALAQLQDQLPPFETATALALIEEDLGRPVSFSCYKQPAET